MASPKDPVNISVAALADEPMALAEVLRPWYIADPGPRLKPSTIEFYKFYVNLEGSALLDHLYEIHNRAWPLGEYPCVGLWQWLWSTISTFKIYPVVIDRLQRGEAILDLGCCLGQDLRRLAADGAPTTNMYALDMHRELWELGYDLYRDRDAMKARFIHADILDEGSHLRELQGKIDIFIICKFLHLFSLGDQIAICKKMVDMSTPGAVILGYNLGQKEFQSEKTRWGVMCFHNGKSFKELWKHISKETNTSWAVEVEEVEIGSWGTEPEDSAWMPSTMIGLNFTVTRSDKGMMAVDKP